MQPEAIIDLLEANAAVFESLLRPAGPELQRWRPAPGKWCLLEIVCHLLDEERDDFGIRLRHIFTTPDQPFPPTDPEGWVSSRQYISRDYHAQLAELLTARRATVEWLRALPADTPWPNTYHPRSGRAPISAALLLANWAAHDYLHIRQINRLQYEYLSQHTDGSLEYAGN